VRLLEDEERMDRDRVWLRLAWVIAGLELVKVRSWASVREAARNVVSRRPPTHWRSGVRVYQAHDAPVGPTGRERLP
jgi:hypothetical protein